jgi:hypothetical protein
LRTLPQTSPDLRIPSSAAIGQMPGPQTAPSLPLVARKSSVVFSDLPAPLNSPTSPAFTFHLSRPDAPANPRFRVAIDRGGAIQYCFLIDSSGDPALDEQARQFLLRCRFPSRAEAGENPIWSIATILWGNDFAPLPSPAPAP